MGRWLLGEERCTATEYLGCRAFQATVEGGGFSLTGRRRLVLKDACWKPDEFNSAVRRLRMLCALLT